MARNWQKSEVTVTKAIMMDKRLPVVEVRRSLSTTPELVLTDVAIVPQVGDLIDFGSRVETVRNRRFIFEQNLIILWTCDEQ